MTPKQAIEKAVDILGGVPAVMKLTDKGQGTVWGWINTTGKTPPEYVLQFERECFAKGKPLTRWDMRPDIFGTEPSQQDINAAEYFNEQAAA